jgi:nitrogen fixation/metabolism regulation signal transduction histidine kinase
MSLSCREWMIAQYAPATVSDAPRAARGLKLPGAGVWYGVTMIEITEAAPGPLPGSVLEALPGAVGVFDAEGTLVYANTALARLLGDAAPEGRPLSSRGERYRFLDGEDKPLPEETWPLARALGGEEARGVELTLELAAGDRASLLAHAAPLPEGGALLYFEDITARREQGQKRAERLSGVIHDLKNPLAAIRFSTEALKMRLKPQEGDSRLSALDRILECVERISRGFEALYEAALKKPPPAER